MQPPAGQYLQSIETESEYIEIHHQTATLLDLEPWSRHDLGVSLVLRSNAV